MVEAFEELTLEARDVGRLERFYREYFGCRVISRQDDRVWLAVGEQARFGLWTPGRHVHLAFSAPPGSLVRLAERLSGHAALRAPVEHPVGDRSLYVQDPEGNAVEVWNFFRRAEGARDGVEALG